jgi:hypothetical protein
VPVELAHIVPWAKVQEHTFENIIALCPTCHARFDNGDIDLKSMQQYKANLAIVTGRYGELERRVLDIFAGSPGDARIQLGVDSRVYLMYLLQDGLLREVRGGPQVLILGQPQVYTYTITPAGRQFVDQLRNAQPVEPDRR